MVASAFRILFSIIAPAAEGSYVWIIPKAPSY